MKQVLQNLSNGETSVADVPAPAVAPNRLVIASSRSLISAGTEKMLVEFGQAGWIGKARAQPEKVKQVLDKIRTDGLLPTLDAVFTKLGEPLPLGYCNAGVVTHLGRGVKGFEIGDRVVSNGPHAEIVSVPPLLCAKIPEEVADEEASFTVLAAIALQGIRLAAPTLGETVVVYGLGLIGIVAVQLLRASGCRVIGVDINARRLELASTFGAATINAASCPDVPALVRSITAQRGSDAVVITASTKSDSIISDSAKMCRKRGRVVLVGVVGLNLNRSDFYEKEISFQVSCSYGPGRYDNDYEQHGFDYPLGFVRWTEQRNFEAVLDLLAAKALDFKPLISHRFELAEATSAYSTIQSDPGALGVILEYPTAGEAADYAARQTLRISDPTPKLIEKGGVTAAVIGAGNYARATLLPALQNQQARLKYIVARTGGATLQHAAKKFSVELATTDLARVLSDDEVNTLLVTTNHDSHAKLVCEALEAGRHVFVEKPLAITFEQMATVTQTILAHPDQQLAVGFNRRFSPHISRCRELLRGRAEPLAINILVNAGEIPADHWVHNKEIGGGRIIGEACHFIDLVVSLTGSLIKQVSAVQVGRDSAVRDDKMILSLLTEDGSIASICYFANGNKSFPKETIQIFSDNRVLVVDNFRRTSGHGFKGFRSLRTSRQEKGHRQQFAAFLHAVAQGGAWIIPFSELENVTLTAIAAVESAETETNINLFDYQPESTVNSEN
jgi:predicted dehydrogenase/threonine dehydrogenase-like Zn-dependent dehydrogenase